MSKFELKKTIEVWPVNKRTKIPTGEPPITIPFGAVVEDPDIAWDFAQLTYLGLPYRCSSEMLRAALGAELTAEAAAAPSSKAKAAPASKHPQLQWEKLQSSDGVVTRAKVPGGWLVVIAKAGALFYPDASHKWNGGSLA
jgi:hypothetical protein